MSQSVNYHGSCHSMVLFIDGVNRRKASPVHGRRSHFEGGATHSKIFGKPSKLDFK